MPIQKKDDESFNLESFTLDELGRIPIGEHPSEQSQSEATSELQGPLTSRRCELSKRELLKNQFPADA
jgi:hypothetical protein